MGLFWVSFIARLRGLGRNLSESEDSEEVWGSKKEYGGRGSSIRDRGVICRYWGMGRKEETQSSIMGETGHHSREGHWDLGGYI